MKNKKNFKRILWLLTIAIMIVSVAIPYSFGDSQSELDKVNAERDALNKKYTDTKARSNALASEIKTLEKQIYSSELEINTLENNINTTKDEINQALIDLENKKAEVGEQNENLNERLRAMYKNGEVGMLSVLLGSSNMSEMMTNMDIIERIYAADAEILSELQVQYDGIQAEKDRLLALKERLETQQEEVTAKKASLASSKTTVAQKKKVVDADAKVLSQQIDDLNKEADRLIADILRLQGTDAYVGGTMCWPSQASTNITSPFGNRMHPILKVYKMHTGIDIGAAGGTNILAANSGVVISAGWNNSYGYMVMIDHGGGIVTLYAHSSKLLVSKGDVVSRGQTIALVGSTGMSTGNHLHFEVRLNGAYQNPLNYVSTSVRK
ncbi:MAG: peptidoglycan DD-metalloendopeptidase family protein [Bacillota bacterium]|nr:peptidoglycan DD-metalloendopeptidase family protein [Bacillota bacterium]